MSKATLTAQRLRELLDYDQETGIFTRRIDTKQAKAGQAAGGLNAYGYVRFLVDGRSYLAHRLAWLYVHGEWPAEEIDHINGQRADNRLCNLRSVSPGENRQNERRARSSSKTGLAGTSPMKGRFQASIVLLGKKLHIGTFDTPVEAHQAYIVAKRAMHPACTV